ncbi:hypothetical protein KI387_036631, partial [Taxus chinensis]
QNCGGWAEEWPRGRPLCRPEGWTAGKNAREGTGRGYAGWSREGKAHRVGALGGAWSRRG